MKRSTSFVVITLAVVSVISFTALAVAQRGDERNAVFEGAPKIATSVAGVQLFMAPPAGFNPLTATNRELWRYGLPAAPDKATDPMAYRQWERAMLALKIHATDVKPQPFSSMNFRQVGKEKAEVSGTTSYGSYNWSGIANTNKNKTWNNKTSFDEVVSIFNVPVAQPPFGAPCSDGYWYEVTWNGIGGFTSGESLVQGGSYDIAQNGNCGGGVAYYGWVEWYPSYPILVVTCSGNPCPVGPGDDFVVTTYGVAGTSTQSVFLEDITQQWYGTASLAYVSGPGLVGASAEYIVERIGSSGCPPLGYCPLANYIFQFMGDNYAYDGAGTLFYPGSTSSSTAVITMLADDDSTKISIPVEYGTAGSAGKSSIMLESGACAFSGGCTP